MYSFVFITNRRASFCSIILMAYQILACFSRSDGGKCHSSLSESLEQAHQLLLSFTPHSFWQRLASVLTTHHSSLTNKTLGEHFQRLLILLVRFIVPQPPSPPPKFPAFSTIDVAKPWLLTKPI